MKPKYPQPIGPYSAYRIAGDFVFCSGQIGMNPETGELVQGGIEAETRQVLENIKGVLENSGRTLQDVVKTTIFLADMNDFTKVNKIYGEYFFEPYPARSTVQVAALPKGARVEVECSAQLQGVGSMR